MFIKTKYQVTSHNIINHNLYRSAHCDEIQVDASYMVQYGTINVYFAVLNCFKEYFGYHVVPFS
jgi:hypothetical protein